MYPLARTGLAAAVLAVVALAGPVRQAAPSAAVSLGSNGSIAYTAKDPSLGQGTDIWVAAPNGSDARKLTNFAEFFDSWGPAWSPDGTEVAFGLSNRAVPGLVFIDIVEGTAAAGGGCVLPGQDALCNLRTVGITSPIIGGPQVPTWSPDAQKLAWAGPNGIFVTDIEDALACPTQDCKQQTAQLVLANTPAITYDQPNWSPDGTRIAVRMVETGPPPYGIRYDIALFPAAGGNADPLGAWHDPPGVGEDSGCFFANPNWASSGQEIFYETGDCIRPVSFILRFGSFPPIHYASPPASSIVAINPETGEWRYVTGPFEGGSQHDPAPAPDGRFLLFTGSCHIPGPGTSGLCSVNNDGTGATALGIDGTLPDWQPNGDPTPEATFSARRASTSGLDNLRAGETVSYEGQGWDLNGPPIDILFDGEVVDTVDPPSSAFIGTFQAPDYDDYLAAHAAAGLFPCRAEIAARQGGTFRRLEARGRPGETVHYSNAIRHGGGAPLPNGQLFTCEGVVLRSPDNYAFTTDDSDPFCDHAIQSQTLVTTSQAGRPTSTGDNHTVQDYGDGIWVQHFGPDLSCIDVSGIFADKVFIGKTLVAQGQSRTDIPRAQIQEIEGSRFARPPGPGGASINAEIVRFLSTDPGPNDADQDGIDDAIDGKIEDNVFVDQSDGFSTDFSNVQVGGTTFGKIAEVNGGYFDIKESPDGDIEIVQTGSPFSVSTGEENSGTVNACGFDLRLTPGDTTKVRCDSLSVTSPAGSVEVYLGNNTLAAFPEGADAKISAAGTDEFEIENALGSGADVLVYAEGELSYVEPGGATIATVTPEFERGDVDCSGGVTSVDGLKVLRHTAGLPVAQTEPCTDLGEQLGPELQGDMNCDGNVNAVDSLLVLRGVAGLPVNLPQGCGPIAAARRRQLP